MVYVAVCHAVSLLRKQLPRDARVQAETLQMTDVLFLACNRLEFTRASFTTLVANTDWSLVDTLWIYDDGSTDGTREWLGDQGNPGCKQVIEIRSNLGAPAAIMNDYLSRTEPYKGSTGMFAKIDNDVIVPPGWLNACVDIMERRPLLDLLGIEPAISRTPHYAGGVRSKAPENDFAGIDFNTCAPCDSIGGVGLMRRRPFVKHPDMRPHSTHGGFTEWQIAHADVLKAWAVPPLNVFLLDRLPTEPWASLSRGYIAKGWQRAWSGYDPAKPFWDWWKPTAEIIDITPRITPGTALIADDGTSFTLTRKLS
jgi:glycosyltransferase involved in cell wall biosynthesis